MYDKLENYYESQRDNLVRSIARRAGSPQNAEDVVQEAFYRALKYFGSFHPRRPDDYEESLAAWFKTIMYRALKDFTTQERNQGMSLTDVEEELEEGLTDSADNTRVIKSGLKGVRRLIKGKPEAVKRTLMLFFLYGYQCKEISEIVNEPHNTVKARVARFREELENYREMYSI